MKVSSQSLMLLVHAATSRMATSPAASKRSKELLELCFPAIAKPITKRRL